MRVLVASLLVLGLLVPTAAAEFGRESAAGWPINVDGQDVKPPYPAVLSFNAGQPLNKVGPLTLYPYYPALTAELQRLAADHPDLVKLSSIGKSTLGLDIWMLEIANFKEADLIPLADREVVYLDGGTHSNEYSGVYFNTEVAQFLLDEYATNATAKWIVQHRHVYIVPLVNPDGSNVFGRLNAKVVNVNRNFPATWGTVNEDPVMNNPGPAPASEPETRAIMGILDKLHPDYVNSIHCCGNLWLHPWGAEKIPAAPDLQMFTRICDDVFSDVRKQCGPIWSTIYPASGTTADEGYNRTGASSWSYEMSGRGAVAPWGQPVITDNVRTQERESWRGVMHALLNVEKYGAHPKVTSVEGDASALFVRVKNDGYGNLTAGNVTIGTAHVALPFLAPNGTAIVRVPGSFAPGNVTIALDYTKRTLLAPQGHAALGAALRDVGGKLVGELDGVVLPASVPLDAPTKVPAPSFTALAIVGVGVALLTRARRRG